MGEKKIDSLFPNVSFHHLCFTLPKELRKLLKEHGFLLKCLFTASREIVLSFCRERKLLPAIVSSLHTFGKDLKDNPHIHMLISPAGIDLKAKRHNKWKNHSFFPFKMLHKRYRFLLVKHLKKSITHYLKEHPEEKGELKVFRAKEVLDAFFDPLLKINWYVYDSNPYDNATCESFIKTLKDEEVYLWEYRTMEDAQRRISHFIKDVYNERRLHSSLGYRPPNEFEELLREKQKSTTPCQRIPT